MHVARIAAIQSDARHICGASETI